MPGKIIRINVEIGTEVKKGESLLVTEAMKMENNILAKCDGVVEQIIHPEGSQIDNGDLLIVLK